MINVIPLNIVIFIKSQKLTSRISMGDYICRLFQSYLETLLADLIYDKGHTIVLQYNYIFYFRMLTTSEK